LATTWRGKETIGGLTVLWNGNGLWRGSHNGAARCWRGSGQLKGSVNGRETEGTEVLSTMMMTELIETVKRKGMILLHEVGDSRSLLASIKLHLPSLLLTPNLSLPT
jgi:hypothetical protein